MRRSQENPKVSSSNVYSQKETAVSASIDNVRQTHNYSATIEGSRVADDVNPHHHASQESNQRGDHRGVNQRKRSMPPASVHIPLLDFSKLHKPQ